MKKYEILSVDYDGTLVDDDKNLSKNNLEAIRGFVNRGGKFVVNTGRMTSGINHLLISQGIDFNVLLSTYNGAIFSELKTGKVLKSNAIDNKACIEVYEFVKKFNVNIMFYPNDIFIAEKESEFTDYYKRVTGAKMEIHPSIHDYLKASGCESPKILIFDKKELLDKIFDDIKDRFKNLEVVRSNAFQIDINKKGVSKGEILKDIANYYGKTVEDVIAVGDAGNDMEMLKTAGFSVAVNNALDSVKEITDYVAPDNNSDAIKHVIDKFCI